MAYDPLAHSGGICPTEWGYPVHFLAIAGLHSPVDTFPKPGSPSLRLTFLGRPQALSQALGLQPHTALLSILHWARDHGASSRTGKALSWGRASLRGHHESQSIDGH